MLARFAEGCAKPLRVAGYAPMFEGLIVRFGYVAIGLGTFFEGEAVLLAAGALAHKGLLSLPWVVCSATLGSLAWAQLWFQLGRALGGPLIERRPKWRARACGVERFVARYGSLFVLGFRFVSGMGTLAPALLGVSRYPAGRFITFDVWGAALWAAAFAGAGWGLGASLGGLLGRDVPWPTLVSAVLGLGVLLWLAARLAQLALSRRASRQRAR
jgi:membrane protein DedA with SNARE-associated domain